MKNHYETLSLSPIATPEQIKAAYTNAILKLQGTANFAAAFAELRNAYDTLSDPISRKKYNDEMGFSSFHFEPSKDEAQPSEKLLWNKFSNSVSLFYRNSFLKRVVGFITNPFISPFRQLPLGYYRLFWASWFIIPFLAGYFVYLLQDNTYKSNDYKSPEDGALEAFIFLWCAYYPIARIMLWVWKGFNESKTKT